MASITANSMLQQLLVRLTKLPLSIRNRVRSPVTGGGEGTLLSILDVRLVDEDIEA